MARVVGGIRRNGTRGAFILLGGVVLLLLIWLFRRPLALFVISITLAAALAPIVEFLARRLPRGVAVLIPYLLLLLVFGVLLWVILRPLVIQVNDLITQAPDLAQRFQDRLQRLELPFNMNLRTTAGEALRSVGPQLFSVPFAVADLLVDLGLILFTSIYMLIESPGIEAFFLSLFPESRRERARNVAQEMLQAMGGYIRATMINGLIVGSLMYAGLLLIGVNYALVLSLLGGLLELVPIIGPVIATIPVVLVALVESPLQAGLALALMIVIQQLEGNLIMPHIMETQTPISPLLAILAFSAGAAVAGLIGAVVAIPIAAALQVLVVKVIAPAVRERTGAA